MTNVLWFDFAHHFVVTYGMFVDLVQGLKELVFPDNCFLCRHFLNSRHQEQLCPSCKASIAPNAPPFCLGCARHLEHFSVDGLCASCRAYPPKYDRSWSVCLYNEPMRNLIHAFKYTNKTGLKKTFDALIQSFVAMYHVPMEEFEAVAPIPLHPTRLRERGFNQAQILSELISQRYQLSHKPHLLIRQRFTGSQTQLPAKERFTNLEGAFKINPSESKIPESVLIVDDLLTTGATINAAAAALKDAGTSYVGAMTLAVTE